MTEQKYRAPRRWLYIPFIVGAVIIIAYGFLWRAGAAEMQRQIGVWIADQRQAGIDISHGDITTGGFPFFLRGKITDIDVAAPGQWRWRAEALAIDALPYDLNRLIFSPKGEQRLEADGLGAWRIKGQTLRASIANDAERQWVFSVSINDAQGRSEDSAATFSAATFSIASLDFDLAPLSDDPATLRLNLRSDGIKANYTRGAIDLAKLNTMLALHQAQTLSHPDGLDAWRAAGGALYIIAFTAAVDNTELSVNGRIKIDKNNYPAGRLNTEIINPGGFARALGAAGVLTPEKAAQAEAGLTVMALAGGGKVSAPIDMQGGMVEIAGIKIADIRRSQP